MGLESENLAIDCAHTLYEELKSDRAISGRKNPRVYVGVEKHCPVWQRTIVFVPIIVQAPPKSSPTSDFQVLNYT